METKSFVAAVCIPALWLGISGTLKIKRMKNLINNRFFANSTRCLIFNVAFLIAMLPLSACRHNSDLTPEIVIPPPVDTISDNISRADTWVATDALGREIGTQATYGVPRQQRTVGIFYFLWAIGNNGPFDNSKILRENPDNPQWGPLHAFHHWGEPHFGYYVSDDEWVIEKHVQMLTDAGVDVLIFDFTNKNIYLSSLLTLCRVMERMQAQGRATLKLTALFNAEAAATLKNLYDNFYAKGLYRDFWFEWDGKPLALMGTYDRIDEYDYAGFFTFRKSWATTREGGGWFGNGKDAWAWIDSHPQQYGWHTDPAKAEQIAVAAAMHPIFNYGRSNRSLVQPLNPKPAEGICFAQQWEVALKADPEFIFLTGWNEWIAQRFVGNGNEAHGFIGKKINAGDTYFVDAYNEEFSRDCEPMRDGYGDNYYYQMVDNIRKYKGVRTIPVEKTQHVIAIDGSVSDWLEVENLYSDDKGDITDRDHAGYGSTGQLTNTWGRNDFLSAKVTNDNSNVYFLMKTDKTAVLSNEAPIQLFIKTPRESSGWEGFQYRIHILPGNKAELHVSKGGWDWEKTADLSCLVKDQYMELSVPKQRLGLASGSFTLDFKWADNMPQTGDIRDFMDHGDTAPNARFRYRYVFENN
ncbi:MAG: hypothetical protein LBL04_14335 [Bacteroidales bacterium]|jgi:hypothetical protein|nr:hypothetical protein [Bacteroidales bacterium]